MKGWLARLGVAERPDPTVDTLGLLIRRQLCTIPFENIDPYCGQVPRLEPDVLRAKLIDGRRGGYCFELNSLLAAGLAALGYRVTHRLARVLWQRAEPGPWTHHVLVVEAEGAMWLADAGFGGPGPDRPVPLDGPDAGGDLRLSDAPGLGRVLSRQGPDGAWRPLYAFGTDTVGQSDLEAGNWLAATFPGSIFRHDLMAALGDSARRGTLKNGQFRCVDAGVETESAVLESQGAVLRALETEFGIHLPAPTQDALLRRLGKGALPRG